MGISSPLAEQSDVLSADPTALDASFRARFIRRLRADPATLIAAGYLVILIVLATIGAPIAAALTGHSVNEQFFNGLNINGIPLPPLSHEIGNNGQPNPHGAFFVLGTDRLGRDMLVRLLYGARTALAVGIGATAVAVVIGLTLGMTAGYFGGALDSVVSRGIETAMAFPSMLFAIGLAAVLGPGLINSIIVISLFSWYYPARIVRNAVLALKHEQFVEAARSIGLSHTTIMRRHLLPLLTAPLIVYSTGVIALNILFEAGLSYLGLGVKPPTADWGQMIADGVTSGLYRVQFWTALLPALALVFTTLAFNQLGDGLRDAFAVRGSIR